MEKRWDEDKILQVMADFIKLATREEHNWPLRLAAWFTGLPIYRSVDWRRVRRKPFRLPREVTLGCIPEYPTELRPDNFPYNLADKLPEPFGWSSHGPYGMPCVIAAISGASVVEAHLKTTKLDPEQAWSIKPATFARMATAIRRMGR